MENQVTEIKFALLGPPIIEVGGKDVNGRLPAKARILLYYLVSNPQPHDRRQLAEWNWEEGANPLNSLRGALFTIRRHLGHDIVNATQHTLGINQNYNYILDVEEFDNFIRLANKVTGATERAHLRDAVELFRGDFLQNLALDNLYLNDQWLQPERERLHREAVSAFDRLVEICRQQGDVESGIKYVRSLLELEPWLESAHRQLIRFYDLIGKRSLALKQFDILEEELAEHFDISPSQETFDLYREISESKTSQVTRPLTTPIETDNPAPFLAPKLVPYFSGRDTELAELQARLLPQETCALFGLVGQPGVGKTALAIELAHRLRDVFPDGVLWMNADLDDPMSVAERWANAFGSDFSRIPDLNERTAVLRDLLAEKQALIICDDVTNAAKTRPFLPQESCCTILLTSRSEDIIHKLGAEMVNVRVLSEGNGRSLLASIISEERVAAEETAATEILRLLDGLPLAIAIAGQRLALRSRRKLGSLAAQLHDESARIDLAHRDRAIRTSFAVSWNGLDQMQQRVFAMLAVFAGRNFATQAAAAIAEMDYYAALERLDDLTSLSLLNDVGDERYRQHALLADYAQEKLGDTDAPYHRMIAYFQTFATDHQEDYAKLELEWENLSASIEHAQHMTQWSAVLDLTNTLQPAWFRRGRYHEARQAFPLAVAAAKALGDQQALANSLYYWGYICWEQNDWDEAEEKLSTSLKLFTESGDQAGEAKVQRHLGVLAKDRGNFAEAKKYLDASMQVRERLDDQQGIAEAIYEKAHLHFGCGNYNDARNMYEQALAIQEKVDDHVGVLRTLRSLANVTGIVDSNNLDLRTQYTQRALSLANELQDQVEITAVYKELFKIYFWKEQYQKAEEVAFKNLDLQRKIGDRRGQSMNFYLLSGFYLKQEMYESALKYCQKGLEICQTLGDVPGIAFSLQRLGEIYNHLNQYSIACEKWRDALEIARQIGHKPLIIELEERLKQS